MLYNGFVYMLNAYIKYDIFTKIVDTYTVNERAAGCLDVGN